VESRAPTRYWRPDNSSPARHSLLNSFTTSGSSLDPEGIGTGPGAGPHITLNLMPEDGGYED